LPPIPPPALLTVDLPQQNHPAAAGGGRTFSFVIDPGQKEALVLGLESDWNNN